MACRNPAEIVYSPGIRPPGIEAALSWSRFGMRIAFVSGNREKLPDAVIPLGLLCVAASIPERHSTTVLDLCFEDEPAEALARRIREFQPEVVALGMRNIQSADYSGVHDAVDYYAELIETIRDNTTAPVVMGGSGFSVMPTGLMTRLRPDFGISSEAEQAFPALLEALEGHAGLEKVGNLHRFSGGKLVSNPAPRSFLEMDRLRPPDRSWVDPRYYEQFGIESLQTKRGCPLRCDYCTYPTIEGRVGRLRSPAAVVDELQSSIEPLPGVNHFFVVDSVFNLPRSHAKEVCREMIERRTTLPWTCYANPLGFDEELAELMAQAGCAGIEVGSDSGSDRMLTTLRKGFTTRQIRELSHLAGQAGVPDCHTFLLGTPGESFDDVLRTLEFIVDLDPFGAILMAWVDDYEALEPELAKQRRLLRDAVLELLDAHKGDYPWWIIPSLGVNFDPALFELLRSRGCQGPLWQHLRGLAGPPRRRPRRQPQPSGPGRPPAAMAEAPHAPEGEDG
jgi:radical SAM superfamily enzyme YgiQ (UPF0313 family)